MERKADAETIFQVLAIVVRFREAGARVLRAITPFEAGSEQSFERSVAAVQFFDRLVEREVNSDDFLSSSGRRQL